MKKEPIRIFKQKNRRQKGGRIRIKAFTWITISSTLQSFK